MFVESSFEVASRHNENLNHPSQRSQGGEELSRAVDNALDDPTRDPDGLLDEWGLTAEEVDQ